MALAVKQLNLQFDAELLLKELHAKMVEVGQEKALQFLLTPHPSAKLPNESARWVYGAGSLFDDKFGRYWAKTADFAELHPSFIGTAVGECVELVREVAFAFKKKIGRVRVLTLNPKTCYSLHTDKEEFRFHIPLFTSSSSFFVSDDVIDRMPVAGQLYLFKTNAPHTAVNAHKYEHRSHLVFDTFD